MVFPLDNLVSEEPHCTLTWFPRIPQLPWEHTLTSVGLGLLLFVSTVTQTFEPDFWTPWGDSGSDQPAMGGRMVLQGTLSWEQKKGQL